MLIRLSFSMFFFVESGGWYKTPSYVLSAVHSCEAFLAANPSQVFSIALSGVPGCACLRSLAVAGAGAQTIRLAGCQAAFGAVCTTAEVERRCLPI